MRDWSLVLWRLLLLIVLIVAWQVTADWSASPWTSSPILIAKRIAEWVGGELWIHLWTTLCEIILGLGVGVPIGVVAGLMLGRMPLASLLLRPLIVALYSVPLVTLAPLLILWFGLDMAPKIFLVAGVSFFLLFFSTFSGVQGIDSDQSMALQLMGASEIDMFFKLVVPASMAWIWAGLKIAMPYALIAATVGEMMVARSGMGFLLTRSASQIDMTGTYAALLVLMLLGVMISTAAASMESYSLRWRETAR